MCWRRGVGNGRGLTAYADFLENEYPDAGKGDSARVLEQALLGDPMSALARFKAAVWSTEDGTAKAEVVEQKILEVLEEDPNFAPALGRYGKYRGLFDGRIAEGIRFEEHAKRGSLTAYSRNVLIGAACCW